MVLEFKFVTYISYEIMMKEIDERNNTIALTVFRCLIQVCNNEERTFTTFTVTAEQKKGFFLVSS